MSVELEPYETLAVPVSLLEKMQELLHNAGGLITFGRDAFGQTVTLDNQADSGGITASYSMLNEQVATQCREAATAVDKLLGRYYADALPWLNTDENHASASVNGGHYTVTHYPDEVGENVYAKWDTGDRILDVSSQNTYDTMEQAKAACQAHHDARLGKQRNAPKK